MSTATFYTREVDNKSKAALFLENQESIRNVISASGCVVAVLQAHLHYFHSKADRWNSLYHLSAMGDNVCGPHVRDNIPEIYTILLLIRIESLQKLSLGTYCFAGYEGN